MQDTIRFKCPHCEADYKVARIEAPAMRDKPVLCEECGGPLRNREGKFALRYFRTYGSRSGN
jgi:predicted Zn finger-like uncharacterized protein